MQGECGSESMWQKYPKIQFFTNKSYRTEKNCVFFVLNFCSYLTLIISEPVSDSTRVRGDLLDPDESQCGFKIVVCITAFQSISLFYSEKKVVVKRLQKAH